MDRPDLFTYLDHRAFLRDWFDWRKVENKRYSYRVFARMAGLRTPSLLVHVINGERNLTASSAEAFMKAMRLDDEERAFFRDLVELECGGTPDVRNAAMERISATKRFREARQIEGEAWRCLSHWYYAAIHELVRVPGFRADPRWIAGTLRPPITEAEAATALAELQSLGLLVQGEDGRLRQADASLVTPPEIMGLAANNYHRGASRLAGESVTAFPAPERHLLGVTVACSAALVPTLKAELNALQARMLDLCDAEGVDPERVFQVNLQLFPLSAPDGQDPAPPAEDQAP